MGRKKQKSKQPVGLGEARTAEMVSVDSFTASDGFLDSTPRLFTSDTAPEDVSGVVKVGEITEQVSETGVVDHKKVTFAEPIKEEHTVIVQEAKSERRKSFFDIFKRKKKDLKAPTETDCPEDVVETPNQRDLIEEPVIPKELGEDDATSEVIKEQKHDREEQALDDTLHHEGNEDASEAEVVRETDNVIPQEQNQDAGHGCLGGLLGGQQDPSSSRSDTENVNSSAEVVKSGSGQKRSHIFRVNRLRDIRLMSDGLFQYKKQENDWSHAKDVKMSANMTIETEENKLKFPAVLKIRTRKAHSIVLSFRTMMERDEWASVFRDFKQRLNAIAQDPNGIVQVLKSSTVEDDAAGTGEVDIKSESQV